MAGDKPKTAREQLDKLRHDQAQAWAVPEVMDSWDDLNDDEKIEYLFRVLVELDHRVLAFTKKKR